MRAGEVQGALSDELVGMFAEPCLAFDSADVKWLLQDRSKNSTTNMCICNLIDDLCASSTYCLVRIIHIA